MDSSERFDSVLYGVAPALRRTLEFLPITVKSAAQEIRLRAGKPVALTVDGRSWFVLKNGRLTDGFSPGLLVASPEQLEESFRLLCHDSVYAHSAEIAEGYIMMTGGHRAGLCGTVTPNGGLRDISSVNIRIAREFPDCALPLLDAVDGGGMLLCGPPGSGKTTLLRDLCRQLSNGIGGRIYRVAVVDSRGELSGSCGGIAGNDLGNNTDVLVTSDKAAGAQSALRTMFPEILAFDEIGTAAELQCVAESMNAGVTVLTTAHIGEKADIMRRRVTKNLINSGAVSRVVLLSPKIGEPYHVYAAQEFKRVFHR
ncbi:MAG: AAA family ATPase [Clostridia bacterium]|nr:AAA family ATPase [Clostridia bacterium]